MIRGGQVFLRSAELEDSRILSAWLNDEDINKNLDIIYPVSKRYADSFIMEFDGCPDKKLFIIDNMDRKPIGMVILDKIRWEFKNCEIGVVIYEKGEQGKGYGRDALTTALNFAFNNMNLELVYLNVLEENQRAVNLYRETGFLTEGILRDRIYRDGKYKNVISMSIKRGDYR